MDLVRGAAMWPFVRVVEMAAALAGALLCLPLLLVAVLRKRAWLDIFELFDACSIVPVLGQRFFSALVGAVAPYSASVGPVITDLSPTKAVAFIDDYPWLRNPFGSVHAIALSNIGELVSGVVIVANLKRMSAGGSRVRARGIVTRINTQFVRKARGRVTATCTVDMPTRVGHHLLEPETQLHDADGNHVATFTAVWNVIISEKEKKQR